MEIIEFLLCFVWFPWLWDPTIDLPNSTFRSWFFLDFDKGSICKSSFITSFTNEFTSLCHAGDVTENHQKSMGTWKSFHFIKNRSSRKTFIFITYLPPKSNDLGAPKDAPETAPRPPRASLGDLWSTLGLRAPQTTPQATQRTPRRPQNGIPRALRKPWILSTVADLRAFGHMLMYHHVTPCTLMWPH